MLTKYSSESLDRTDRPYDASSSERALVALLSDGRIRDENVASSARPELRKSRFAPERADRNTFPIDGFALYGASVHQPAICLSGDGHRNTLTSLWKAIAIRWICRRRERGIKRTTFGAAEFDDLILQDIGFPDRSRMQHAARYERNLRVWPRWMDEAD
jgi:hypothetical protein